MAAVEDQVRDWHAKENIVQLFATKEKEKDFILFMDNLKKKYEDMESNMGSLCSFV
jgi:hypothetical protein